MKPRMITLFYSSKEINYLAALAESSFNILLKQLTFSGHVAVSADLTCDNMHERQGKLSITPLQF